MSRSQPVRPVDPATLPDVWRVTDLAREKATLPTGHPELDAVLPGGGWPVGALVEVLQQTPAQHVWRLLLPALVARMRTGHGPVVLVGAPLQPFGPSLGDHGFDARRLLCVSADQPALRLWAAEQALRCAHVAAVLAWLPGARSEELRRLHLAAQRHDCLLFALRPAACRQHASPATLRLQLHGMADLEIEIVKRRGPPLVRPLVLPATTGRLAALLRARRSNAATPTPAVERSHVLDRTAAVQ